MPPDPLESSLIFILLQICSDVAAHRKKPCARKFWAPLLRKFLDTFHEIIQLMRKVRDRVEKARNCGMLVDIKGSHLELFWGGKGQQSSHGTGGGARAKITNAKGGVTEKV